MLRCRRRFLAPGEAGSLALIAEHGSPTAILVVQPGQFEAGKIRRTRWPKANHSKTRF